VRLVECTLFPSSGEAIICLGLTQAIQKRMSQANYRSRAFVDFLAALFLGSVAPSSPAFAHLASTAFLPCSLSSAFDRL
jgi:hypothetical protein